MGRKTAPFPPPGQGAVLKAPRSHFRWSVMVICFKLKGTRKREGQVSSCSLKEYEALQWPGHQRARRRDMDPSVTWTSHQAGCLVRSLSVTPAHCIVWAMCF